MKIKDGRSRNITEALVRARYAAVETVEDSRTFAERQKRDYPAPMTVNK